MNRLFVLFISLTIFLSFSNIAMAYEKEIKSLSSTMAENIVKTRKKTIAVVDFTDLQGNVTELGRFLAEEFSVCLAGAGKGFEVIDRTHLKTILKEHKLAITGIIDPTTARKLGQIAGVDALVTGTITPFGDSVRISVKILDAATAKVIGASSGDIAKTKAIEELLGKGIETGLSAAPETLEPPSKTQQRVEVQNFVTELQSCKASGQTVTCYLLITNKGNDKTLYFNYRGYRHIRIIDDAGNEYQATRYQLGDKIGEAPHGNVSNLLVSGIPTKINLTIENVSIRPRKIALLEIGCSTGDYGKDFLIQLRNIPLSR